MREMVAFRFRVRVRVRVRDRVRVRVRVRFRFRVWVWVQGWGGWLSTCSQCKKKVYKCVGLRNSANSFLR